MSWTDVTTPSTNTAHNSSRFIGLKEVQDAQGGVDFQLQFSTTNPFYFTASDPVYFSSSTRNDPTG